MPKYASTFKERASLIRQNNYLPLSWIIRYPVDRNGRVILDSNNSLQFIEDRDNVETFGRHEKNRPDILGVNVPNTEFYQEHFVARKNAERTIAASSLEINPLNGHRVNAIVHNTIQPYAGTAIINYDQLISEDGRKINVIRLQEFLISMGFGADINSFYDLQNILKHPTVQELFSQRGLDQLALSSYFIPNAIGETDANSRNILLVVDPTSKKIDSVIRIDPDKNILFDQRPNDPVIIPKGIFVEGDMFTEHGESYEQYMGYIKNHNQFSAIDWELFVGYYELSKYFLSKDDIRKAIHKGYKVNQDRCTYGYNQVFGISRAAMALSIEAYDDFINDINKRVSYIHNDIDSRIHGILPKLPNENGSFLESAPFKTQLFDKKGRPIPVNEIPEGPIF